MSEKKAATDLDSIALYLSGDAAAFREMDSWIRSEIEVRYPSLREEIEDLCQAVHVKLLKNLRGGRFRGGSNLRTYVASISHYTAIDRIRLLYRERAVFPDWEASLSASEDNPYRSMTVLQDQQRLHLAVQRAPAQCRELWRMIFLGGLSYEEISRRLAIPSGTVKSRTWYCRRRLLALLDQLGKRRTSPRRPSSRARPDPTID